MLQNAGVTFTVSELLKENQLGRITQSRAKQIIYTKKFIW